MKKRCLTFYFLCACMGSSLLAQDYRIENNFVIVSPRIAFKPGTAVLLPESDAALVIIKKYLDDKSYVSLLRVEAHTDHSAIANQLLTEKQAAAVCQRLILLGADCQRLLPVGFGGNKPIADNASSTSKATNTRISFVNVSLKGKSIGGMPVDGGGNIAENPCY